MKVINVLGDTTYNDCHIKNTINVPLSQLEEFVKTLARDEELIVYCASYKCPASRKAWQLLTSLGFSNVKAYEGGINEWHQKNYPCEGPCKEAYIHEKVDKPTIINIKVKEISAEELKDKLSL